MKNASRKLVGLSAASLFSAGVAVIPAATAHAASSCWDAGFTAPDAEHRLHEAYYCNNVSPTYAYSNPSLDWDVVGTLVSNPSWFVCSMDNGAPNGEVNGPHPTRWLYTQTDTGAWGWVSDNKILSETDPVPTCSLG